MVKILERRSFVVYLLEKVVIVKLLLLKDTRRSRVGTSLLPWFVSVKCVNHIDPRKIPSATSVGLCSVSPKAVGSSDTSFLPPTWDHLCSHSPFVGSDLTFSWKIIV